MANINFKPWLGDGAISDPTKLLQNTYNGLTAVGFQPNGFVKAGDFNAALRMTTLVCAGLANALGFDATQTIDSSEAAIAAAIKTPTFTSLKTTGDVTADGALIGASLKIGNTERISSTGKVTASDVDVGNSINASTIHAVSEVSGGEISSEGDVTASGTVYGDSLDIGGGAAQISSAGDFTGRNIDAKAVKATSITNTGLYSGKNITGTNLTVTNVYGTGGAAPTFQNGITVGGAATFNGACSFNQGATFSGSTTIPNTGLTTSGSLSTGWATSIAASPTYRLQLELSSSEYSNLSMGNGCVAAQVGFRIGSISERMMGLYLIEFPKSDNIFIVEYAADLTPSIIMELNGSVNANNKPVLTLVVKSKSANISDLYSGILLRTIKVFNTSFV